MVDIMSLTKMGGQVVLTVTPEDLLTSSLFCAIR